MYLLNKNYHTFIFDLDDTLYSEIIYLDASYKRIGEFLSVQVNIDAFLIYQFLINEFKHNGRKKLFDKMFDFFSIDYKFLPKILNIMRTIKVDGKIYLNKEMYNILPKIINDSNYVFVVTNGNVIQQKNKVKNIEWLFLDSSIIFVYANAYEKKPSNSSFVFIKNKYQIDESSTIMIGDSRHDSEYAKNSKIDFLDIKSFKKLFN